MKNLSAIPPLSLFVAFTILITLVVCLAGFTEAEVLSSNEKQEHNRQGGEDIRNYSPLREKVPKSYQIKLTNTDVTQQSNFANSRNYQIRNTIDSLLKKNSEDFGELDNDREADGYGYNDDEYYHFHYKRNDDLKGNADGEKSDKNSLGEISKKEPLNSQSFMTSKDQKDNPKEGETIEMLDFKETHPNTGNSNSKSYAKESAHKKLSDSIDSLKMSDLKENSAIDEKMKDRKEESTGGHSSESKISEGKKGAKLTEDKTSLKIKDSKLKEDSEKKEKDVSLKEAKESVASKNLKESAKSTEEKEKMDHLKLNANAKLEENEEKITRKAKESEAVKIAKEDKENSRFTDKDIPYGNSPEGISELTNRANFVSNDYKDNMYDFKTSAEEQERNSEDMSDDQTNIGLIDYQDSIRRNREGGKARKYDFMTGDESAVEISQGMGKMNDYFNIPISLEVQSDNSGDYYSKRDSWKAKNQREQFQDQPQDPQQIPQQPQDQPYTFDHSGIKDPYHLNFQTKGLENTDYHKNYLKSLKRYKGLDKNSKILNPDSKYDINQKTTKKKRSKGIDSRSMTYTDRYTEPWEGNEKTPNRHSNVRRHVYSTADTLAYSLQPFLTQPRREVTNLRTFGPLTSERQARKSPQKLEYEIKIINQNQPNAKGIPLSSLSQKRRRKDVRTKLSDHNESKNLKKFSQVSRDDLTKFKQVSNDGEKKYKRKASFWRRRGQFKRAIQKKESVIRTREVPSGYYSNRVKFGQKHVDRNEERTPGDSPNEVNPYSYNEGQASESNRLSLLDKNPFQRSWDRRSQEYIHDPAKRFDSTVAKNHGSNSLYLIKKDKNGDKIAKAFSDENSPGSKEEVDPDQLSKLLSKDNDYYVFKKSDNNKKISESSNHLESGSSSSSKETKKSEVVDVSKPDGIRGTSKQNSLKNRAMSARSFLQSDDDKKLGSKSQNTAQTSNLRKALDKFKDLAEFFKDNEQEPTYNQHSNQEVKGGSDIVFSEDKLPDPIVINNDGGTFKEKPPNSIYSISTNFKQLDQERKNESPKETTGKNMFTSDSKSNSQESSWEPALKNAFPEAKSINAMQKNGNEIIVLDFNRNQLKTDHGSHSVSPKMGSKQQGSNYLTIPGNRQVGVVMNDLSIPSFWQHKKEENKLVQSREEEPMAVINTGSNQLSIPLSQLVQLPTFIKSMADKKSNTMINHSKYVSKKNAKWQPQYERSQNFNRFLRDYQELSEINRNKGKLTGKRNPNEMPTTNYGMQNFEDPSLKYLGNILQFMIPLEDLENRGNKDNPYEGMYKSIKGRWTSTDHKKNYSPLEGDNHEWVSEEVKREIENLLQGEGMLGVKEKNYQDELSEELSAASDRIQRLRRGGMSDRNLRKTIESALSFRERRHPDQPNAKNAKESRKKITSLAEPKAKAGVHSPGVTGEGKTAKVTGSESHLKESHKGKEREKTLLKSSYENHLSELFENLNSNKNQKGQLTKPKESGANRRKRRYNHRQKRSPGLDVKSKVSSRNEVQNRILKTLPEDNYQSVSSPGIRRKLFSTEDEAEDADGYYDADGLHEGEVKRDCVKNQLNKCIDPFILELFDASGESKNRNRRSLTSAFHSNYKREIDLDESMPNDFQSFLVTSLGGFGSQKREVVKKDEALWEGKESSQDNFNQIADNSPGGKDAYEDSALEKRDVSSKENHKRQTHKTLDSYGGLRDSANPSKAADAVNHSGKKARSQDKFGAKARASEYDDEKIPTHIRIQITDTSSKEKKSWKPIMDESETTSTEMETLPKEKEFFDRNKLNPLRMSTSQKLNQFPKSKYSYALDYGEGENMDGSGRQKLYIIARPQRRLEGRRRKKKKFAEEAPVKSNKDLISFDQKAMEALIKKYFSSDQSLFGATTQKMPVSNHLPQVETVYNPTQGTNKAQIEGYRYNKLNTLNKNVAAKNSYQANEASAFDESILRAYLRGTGLKSKLEKGYPKDFDEVNWKSNMGKMRERQDSGKDVPTGLNFQKYKNPVQNTEAAHDSNIQSAYLYNPYGKWYQPPSYNFFYHIPASVLNSNAFYDTLRIKQDMQAWNELNKDHLGSKYSPKSYIYESLYRKPTDTQRFTYSGRGTEDSFLNSYDYLLNKKLFSPSFRMADYYGSTLKSMIDSQNKFGYTQARNPYKYVKNVEYARQPLIDTGHLHLLDTSRDADYEDDDYLDDDLYKQDSQRGGQKAKAYDTTGYRQSYTYRNSDLDDILGEDEEELDEDYDENADDGDMDDYSQLITTHSQPDISRGSHGSEKFKDSAYKNDMFYAQPNAFSPKISYLDFRENGYDQFKTAKFIPETRPMSLTETLDPSSSSILRGSNENANIFGKNLMNNLNKYNYDDAWKTQDNLREYMNYGNGLSNEYSNLNPRFQNRRFTMQDKLKRSNEPPAIGKRLFFLSKSEMDNLEEEPPNALLSQRRNSRNAYYRPPKRSDLKAELRGAENEFEYESESEEKEKHFDGNIINGDKPNGADQNPEVKENLEDDGDIISEDNVLENVIGKYIMRKSVVPPTGSSLKNSNNREEDGTTHNHRKRSIDERENVQNVKTTRKRLFTGHLAENNFRKYHKKNFNKKRHALNADAHVITSGGDPGKSDSKYGTGKGNEMKRSAMDLFRKITNKEKNKNTESVYSRNAGFEPLMCLNEKKYESSEKESEERLAENERSDRKSKIHENNSQAEIDSITSGEEATIREKKKEKSKEDLKEHLANADGPWRIELDEQYDVKIAEPIHRNHKISFNPDFAGVESKGRIGAGDGQNLKAYLLISKNTRAAEPQPPPSGAFQREVGNSYRPKGENTEKNIRKRSVGSPASREEDGSEMAPTDAHISTENNLDIQETNRALQDTKSRRAHVLQRDTEKKDSVVSTEAPHRNSREKFLSKGKAINRKSVFPPSSDANIIGDSRHLNEETSKYLGQQIVKAILAHATTNPRFKEFIAPGLNKRTPGNDEDAEEKTRDLHKLDFSDQVQSLMEKVMLNLEKLAEKQVKKRMCNKIDESSKNFLQSLLNISSVKIKEPKGERLSGRNEVCKNEDEPVEVATFPGPSRKSVKHRPLKYKQEFYENLKKKQCLLKRLMSDYRHLSELEKQTLDVNYQYLQHELENTNHELESSNYEKTNSGAHYGRGMVLANKTVMEKLNKKPGELLDIKHFDVPDNIEYTTPCSECDKKTTTPKKTFLVSSLIGASNQEDLTHPYSTSTTTPADTTTESLSFTPIFFEPSQEESERQASIYRSRIKNLTSFGGKNDYDPTFEDVTNPSEELSSSTAPRQTSARPKATTSSTITKHEEFDMLRSPVPTAESFDLLPYANLSKTTDASASSERAQIKGSGPDTRDGLHQLGPGDKRGPQLSYRGTWKAKSGAVSRSDFHRGADTSLIDDPKNSGSIVGPHRDLSNLSHQPGPLAYSEDNKKSIFRQKVDQKFYTKKTLPFHLPIHAKYFNHDKYNYKVIPMENFIWQYPVNEKKSPTEDTEGSKSFRGKPRSKRKRRHPRSPERWKAKPEEEEDTSENGQNSEDSLEEDPGLEYLIWSSMPAVRRRLNNLEMGVEFDNVPLTSPWKKTFWKGEKKSESV